MKNKKSRGGVISFLLTLIVVGLLAATAFMSVEYVKRRSTSLGEAAWNARNYREAADYFARALKYSIRKTSEQYTLLARAELECGERDKAREHFTHAAERDKKNVPARYELARILTAQGDTDNARKYVNELRAIGTDEAAAAADELTEDLQAATVKGMLNGFSDKLKGFFNGIGKNNKKGASHDEDDK